MNCSAENWVNNEFSKKKFGDIRLVKRFKKIMLGFMKKATSTISSTFNCWSDIKSSYRFINNDKITLENIMEPHRNKTIERASQEDKILLIQDTTHLDYKKWKKTEDRDSKNSQSKNNTFEAVLFKNVQVNNESEVGTSTPILTSHTKNRKRRTELEILKSWYWDNRNDAAQDEQPRKKSKL